MKSLSFSFSSSWYLSCCENNRKEDQEKINITRIMLIEHRVYKKDFDHFDFRGRRETRIWWIGSFCYSVIHGMTRGGWEKATFCVWQKMQFSIFPSFNFLLLIIHFCFFSFLLVSHYVLSSVSSFFFVPFNSHDTDSNQFEFSKSQFRYSNFTLSASLRIFAFYWWCDKNFLMCNWREFRFFFFFPGETMLSMSSSNRHSVSLPFFSFLFSSLLVTASSAWGSGWWRWLCYVDYSALRTAVELGITLKF